MITRLYFEFEQASAIKVVSDHGDMVLVRRGAHVPLAELGEMYQHIQRLGYTNKTHNEYTTEETEEYPHGYYYEVWQKEA